MVISEGFDRSEGASISLEGVSIRLEELRSVWSFDARGLRIDGFSNRDKEEDSAVMGNEFFCF